MPGEENWGLSFRETHNCHGRAGSKGGSGAAIARFKMLLTGFVSD